MRSVEKRLIGGLTATAESILLLCWISFSIPVVQGFACVILFDPLFTERHASAYEVRAIFCHFDFRAVVFFFSMVNSLFDSKYPTVKR